MTSTPRSPKPTAAPTSSPSANGGTRPVKKHPHAHLVGRPDADTVLLPAVRPAPAAPADPGLDPHERPGRAGRRPARDRADYTLPMESVGRRAPAAGPAVQRSPTRRRTLVSRAVLAAILCCQAALSLRLHNTVFQNEALYLFAGHWELAHWLHGMPVQGDFVSYFPGTPALYPVLGAAVAEVGGLSAARALGLAEMLVVTALLYSLTRQLFNERVGLCAAAIFAVSEGTILLGHLATLDATALLLLAASCWLVVRTASWPWRAYLLAAPLAALAVATSYPVLLYVPGVAGLAGLAAAPYLGRAALSRTLVFGGTTLLLIAMAAAVAGPEFTAAAKSTGSARGAVSLGQILADSGRWAGLAFGLAAIGAIAFAWRPTTEPDELIMPPGGRSRRAALGACLAGAALIAPADQLLLHSENSLATLIAFGTFLCAPVAGVGLARLVGDHFRRPLVGILIWALALTIGLGQASQFPGAWPDGTTVVAQLSHYLKPGAHYLVEDDDVPIYYLDGNSDAEPDQFTSTYYISFPAGHQQLTGVAGYLAAIKAGYFHVIIYDSTVTAALDKTLAQALEASPDYRLAAAFTENASGVRTTCYVWLRI
jgi:Dolichyl-phosphate-mannose-protein mannosyltransferase